MHVQALMYGHIKSAFIFVHFRRTLCDVLVFWDSLNKLLTINNGLM